MIRTLAFLTIGFAAPALAQGMPVFDDAKGFDVVGVMDGSLVVANGGHSFICSLRAGGDVWQLANCEPIIGPAMAAQIEAEERAAVEAAAVEQNTEAREIFLRNLEVMPDVVFANLLADLLRQAPDCTLTASNKQELALIERAYAQLVIERFNYPAGLDSELIKALSKKLEDGGEVLDDREEVLHGSGSVRLKTCPAN
ncbi:hypothetical protein [Tropicibacter naphthalenivorans]|uniref:Uncharacterized protein n=1 Tax=Tropicibacter naphthalenivorans TaxID=441103 RepID=A0A0P1GEZ5_9RHOB|nr:hypothetical protein [Tropicibacter naphthalenivorans]CUH80282.1 hypothetical protein TRN7648_02909 [Tropicibacter naphthalenivorans]SMC85727.1 hypothetical protein SAMN04488093_105178 [Tropicibacter naphthalenivorans]